MTKRYNRNATALATLRVLVGNVFVLFGGYKVFATDFTLGGRFDEWIRSFLAQVAYPWMKPVLESSYCRTPGYVHCRLPMAN